MSPKFFRDLAISLGTIYWSMSFKICLSAYIFPLIRYFRNKFSEKIKIRVFGLVEQILARKLKFLQSIPASTQFLISSLYVKLIQYWWLSQLFKATRNIILKSNLKIFWNFSEKKLKVKFTVNDFQYKTTFNVNYFLSISTLTLDLNSSAFCGLKCSKKR